MKERGFSENLFLLLFVAVFAIGAFVWYTQIRNPAVVETELEGEVDQTFLRTLLAIEQLDKAGGLDLDFFQQEEFTALIDFTPVVERPESEEKGRANPFKFL
jgi:hypothetical protein